MREFKFRVWNGFRIIEDEELRETAEKLHIDAGIYNQYEQDILIPKTEKLSVMQYTGLKDNNGKDIYEGDIVRFLDEMESYTDCGYEYEEYIEVGEVIYNKQLQGWDVTNRYCEGEDVWHYMEYIEVIGNIYENKDLLK